MIYFGLQVKETISVVRIKAFYVYNYSSDDNIPLSFSSLLEYFYEVKIALTQRAKLLSIKMSILPSNLHSGA